MNEHFIAFARKSLFDTIAEMGNNSSLFVMNSEIDFTRKRKINFKLFMKITLGMAVRSMNKLRPSGSKIEYPISFRAIRFLITDNTYETIITNMDSDDFPSNRIKELYHLRWGIETSFGELKYAVGLTNFHTKK